MAGGSQDSSASAHKGLNIEKANMDPIKVNKVGVDAVVPDKPSNPFAAIFGPPRPEPPKVDPNVAAWKAVFGPKEEKVISPEEQKYLDAADKMNAIKDQPISPGTAWTKLQNDTGLNKHQTASTRGGK